MSTHRMTHQHGATRGIGIALFLALLVAVVALMIDPSHVPAADVVDPESVAVGTPLAIDPEPTIEPEDSCVPVEHDETDSVQTPIDVDPQIVGTPVAVIEDESEVEPEECDSPDGPAVAETPTPVVPPAAVTGEPTAELLPGTSTPIAELPVDLSASDPAMIGLPVGEPGEMPTADPFEGGLPAVAVSATAVSDPMVNGIPTTPVSISTGDPAMDGIPDGDTVELPLQDPMLAGSGMSSRVDVIVTGVSVDGVITPGGKISYLFRITNPGAVDVVIDLAAATDLPEWNAVIVRPGSIAPIDGTHSLASGGAMEVLVIVSAPLDASVGDHVVTSLTATIQN